MNIIRKKLALTLATIGLMAVAGMSTASADGLALGIATPGSPHNFTDNVSSADGDDIAEVGDVDIGGVATAGWNQTGEICRVCHVPHDHERTTALNESGLLWNRSLSVANYTLYTSQTLNAVPGQPDGIAKLCLGCHDGTVALDSFDKYAPGTAGKEMEDIYGDHFVVPSLEDGGNRDLRGTHPISILYDAGDSKLHSTSDDMGSSGSIADVLDNGKVQCSTCHDVHDQESVADTHLLRVAQTTEAGGTPSGLCLTCHIK